MSVDARIRKGLTMIERELPGVDTLEEYESLERDIRRGTRRRRVLISAAAAAVLTVAGAAFLVNRSSEEKPEPAPPPALPNRVMMFDQSGAVSFVADDGSRRIMPARNVDRFALSPDGQQIAYITATDAGRRLWIADADGSNRHQLPPPCAGCQPGYGVTWSNDGARIAYPVFTSGHKPAQLRIRGLRTGEEQVITMPAGIEPRGPSFAPDDRTLAVNAVDQSGQYVATLDPTQETSSLTRLTGWYSEVQLPSWSPDGRTVYFTAASHGSGINEASTRNDLYAIGADGSGLRQITRAGNGVRYFAATPYDGRFLISRARGDGPWTVGWLSAEGGTFTPLKGPDGDPVTGTMAELQP